MTLYKMRTAAYRVAVVSVTAAGKTVFLTSLIDHLSPHDPEQFRLTQDPAHSHATVVRFQTLKPETGWSQFPYQRYRDALVHPTVMHPWPPKTTDRSQFVCHFERSDWKLHSAKLTLFDLPGERLADASMVTDDYATWSDHILEVLGSEADNRQECLPYLELL
jgi:predicted YcjX-like family ATPase